MDQVRLFALGGLDEDGKNMYVVEVGESIFVIEAGLKYPESTDQLDRADHSDFKYLLKIAQSGDFLSHGHDDVMAATNLPHVGAGVFHAVNRDADRRDAEKGRPARYPRASR
ncbi:MAG: hypothetical protein ACLSA6_14165 [Holdemania massiliensis]